MWIDSVVEVPYMAFYALCLVMVTTAVLWVITEIRLGMEQDKNQRLTERERRTEA